MTITTDQPPAPTTPADDAIARIDEHLAALPSDRKMVSVGDHVDVLLDLRLIFTGATET